MNLTRRNLLKGLAAAAGVGIAAPVAYREFGVRSQEPGAPARTAGEPAAVASAANPTPDSQPPTAAALPRSLVVIQLAGGNDGLATVLPYADGALNDNRKTL